MIGVNANHEQITTYPHRGDEEFFDIFMNTLSDLVDEVCPKSSMPAFARSDEPQQVTEPWVMLRNMTASTSNLSILSGKLSSPKVVPSI